MASGVSYSVRIKRSAAKELAGIPQPMRNRVVSAIDRLAEEPLAGTPLKGGLRGLRRLRIGDHRVIYELLDNELIILVVRIARRRTVYRWRA
jgi:mRNA interferase RelE/StbE